ncbi:MAG TPA: NAD(P)H-dependent oxidoreductase [Cytophagaceae bacterium]|jgi:NAD(P)H-dependent FMN reductase|nr:NAD(P)H-dependent oxidoreductase [Cytophagaceae bacterium]
MPHISIISSSVRTGRASHRVALYLQKYITEQTMFSTELLDLNAYQFPIFNERLQYQTNPSAQVLEFAGKIVKADGVVIVTPEYNGGYPASLKNVIDLLYKEWHHKPIAIATCSDGSFGGTQVITSLAFSFWKIGAWLVPGKFQAVKIKENYTENGEAINKEVSDKAAAGFLKELLWAIELKSRK